MKTSLFVSALTLITVVSVSSCSKKSDDVTPAQTTTTSQAGFRVKVDGIVYAPDFSYALFSNPGKDGYYAIYGLDSKTSDVVAITLPTTAGEGTFPLSNTNAGIITYNKVDYTTINGGTGTVTITKKTATNVVGTFSFTAYDATATVKRTLTEGSFNVNFR